MIDFVIEGKMYRAERLDPFTQFHVLRRLGSLYPSVVGAVELKDKDPVLAVGYIVMAVAKLSEDDANFVVKTCLKVAKLQQANTWAPLVSAAGDLMFQDIELPVMLQIVWHVLEDNFGPFTHALLAMCSKLTATA